MKEKIPVRQRILETATRLFYTQGYNSTGINQIIYESEVAKMSFYDHFPTKEDLCVIYLIIDSDNWIAAMKTLVQTKKTVNTKVAALFDHIAAFSQENNYRGCAF